MNWKANRPCEKCGGAGWLWWHELEDYFGPAIETGNDDTRYLCDNTEAHVESEEIRLKPLPQRRARRSV